MDRPVRSTCASVPGASSPKRRWLISWRRRGFFPGSAWSAATCVTEPSSSSASTRHQSASSGTTRPAIPSSLGEQSEPAPRPHGLPTRELLTGEQQIPLLLGTLALGYVKDCPDKPAGL